MGDFCCHLHCHSRFSFYDGANPPEDLVERAAQLEQPGIVLTDHGVMYGAAALFKATKEHGIKGGIGMEVYEAVPHEFDIERDIGVFKTSWDKLPEGTRRYFHLTLWAASQTGYENLCRLHTASFRKDHKPKTQPLVDRAMLERNNEGIIVGLGCVASRTNVALAENNDPAIAIGEAAWYFETFPGRVYVEVMANTEDQQRLIRPQRKLATHYGAPTVATNDVHYKERRQGRLGGSHHIMVQGRRFKKKDGEETSEDKSDAGYGRWYGSDGFYLKSGAEMLATGGLQRDEIERTVEVLGRLDFDFNALPHPKPPVARIPAPGEDPAFDQWLEIGT